MKTALVGPSGAGKTAITQLVPRLYDVQGGSVAVNGIDVRDASLDSLHDRIGVVTQDAHLFHDTIRAILTYARPEASDAEITEALRAAQILPLVSSLPKGLETLVGERGYRFSGGEKQRLAIARLLLKAPDIVILDEATAHLDSESEAAIQKALETALARDALPSSSRIISRRFSKQIKFSSCRMGASFNEVRTPNFSNSPVFTRICISASSPARRRRSNRPPRLFTFARLLPVYLHESDCQLALTQPKTINSHPIRLGAWLLHVLPSHLLTICAKRTVRVALRVAPALLVFFLLAFGASRLRPQARTPFCFADATTAQEVMHAPVVVVSPSVIDCVPHLELHPIFYLSLKVQASVTEAALPSLLRAPPVFRI